jgi:hypothetical protein
MERLSLPNESRFDRFGWARTFLADLQPTISSSGILVVGG